MKLKHKFNIYILKASLKILLIISLFIISFTSVSAKVEGVPEDVYKWYPKYVTFLPEEHLDSVLQFSYTDIVPVKFNINDDEFNPSSELQEIVKVINNVLHDERVNLAYIWIGGSASPDGPSDKNNLLAEKRGKALADYIKSHTDVPHDKIKVENLGECWYSIMLALSTSDLDNKDELIDKLDAESDIDKKEFILKRHNNGYTWDEIKTEILPLARNARMVIVCSAEDIKEPEPEPVVEEPKVEPQPEPKPEPIVIPMPEIETRFLAVKTNLLFGAATIANIGFETELGRKWSIDIPFYYSPYNISSDRKLRVMAIQPELRRWLTKAGEGHFFGIHGHLAGFNVAINDNGRYQDPDSPLWGFGLGYGYALNFGASKNWGLEFNIGIGFANYKYDAYYNRPNGQKFDSGSGWWWGPTRAGITLTYKWWIPRKVKIKEVKL